MLLTKKMRIYPTKPQEDVLWVLSERCRLLYNFALAERRTIWIVNKDKPPGKRQKITYRDQQNQLPALKREFPEYQWVYSKVLQMTLRKLDAAYRSYFILRQNGDKTARPPQFRGKKHFFTLCYNQSGFQVAKGILKLSHKYPSRLPLAFQLPQDAPENIKQVELTQDFAQRWFVCIQYEVEPPVYVDNGLYQAIDLGLDNIVSAVNLAGKFTQFENKRPDKYWRPKLAAVQAKRDGCTKGSRKWQWYSAKYQRMQRKQANQLRDWQHHIAKVVVTNTRANTIIIGEPEPKQMASKTTPATKRKTSKKKRKPKKSSKKATRTLHYSLQNTGSMSRFAEFLAYKAEKLGKRVIRVSEAYTSQTCCKCGYQEPKPLSERLIECGNCGNQIDRDLNAAINIMVRFLVQKDLYGDLLPEPSVTEESFLSRWKGFLRYARSLGPDDFGTSPITSRRSANRKTKVSSSLQGEVGTPRREPSSGGRMLMKPRPSGRGSSPPNRISS